MRKIAFLLPDFCVGGMPRVASNIIKYLNENEELEITIILMNSSLPIKYETFDSKIIKMFPLGKNKLSKIITFLKRISSLKKIKKVNSFDVVISFGVAANTINILTKMNEKIIITEHNIKSIENSNWGFFGKIYDFLMKILYNQSDLIITVSEGIKKDLVINYKINPNKIRTIYNPMDIKTIKSKSKIELSEDIKPLFKNKINLLIVGRLSQEKGHITLLKILKDIKKVINNVQVVFLGTGDFKEYLINYCEKNELINDVIFLDYNENPFNIIKNVDLVIVPSLNEGFCNIIIETLIVGTPIISTDFLVGAREIMIQSSDYNDIINKFIITNRGILTSRLKKNIYIDLNKLTKEEKDMRDAIIYTLNNYNVIYERVKKVNVDEFSIENIGREYLETIKKVLDY